jgi:hypothetical protein
MLASWRINFRYPGGQHHRDCQSLAARETLASLRVQRLHHLLSATTDLTARNLVAGEIFQCRHQVHISLMARHMLPEKFPADD